MPNIENIFTHSTEFMVWAVRVKMDFNYEELKKISGQQGWFSKANAGCLKLPLVQGKKELE